MDDDTMLNKRQYNNSACRLYGFTLYPGGGVITVSVVARYIDCVWDVNPVSTGQRSSQYSIQYADSRFGKVVVSVSRLIYSGIH